MIYGKKRLRKGCGQRWFPGAVSTPRNCLRDRLGHKPKGTNQLQLEQEHHPRHIRAINAATMINQGGAEIIGHLSLHATRLLRVKQPPHLIPKAQRVQPHRG